MGSKIHTHRYASYLKEINSSKGCLLYILESIIIFKYRTTFLWFIFVYCSCFKFWVAHLYSVCLLVCNWKTERKKAWCRVGRRWRGSGRYWERENPDKNILYEKKNYFQLKERENNTHIIDQPKCSWVVKYTKWSVIHPEYGSKSCHFWQHVE